MGAQLEKLKQEVEADLGRPMDVGEEIETKALFYFSKGVELKNELESEPVHIKAILPAVMPNIEGRIERQSKSERRSRIIEAVGGFLSGRPRRQRAAKRSLRQ